MSPAPHPGPLFNIVLHTPEIPNNTGNIGRTCVATGCALHLIHPLGFDIDDKACRRARLDYWPRLQLHEHQSEAAYLDSLRADRPTNNQPNAWFFSARAEKDAFDQTFQPGDHFVFGRESSGLPRSILDEYPDRVVGFPMVTGERSLNLSNAVCVAIYEGIRQARAAGWLTTHTA